MQVQCLVQQFNGHYVGKRIIMLQILIFPNFSLKNELNVAELHIVKKAFTYLIVCAASMGKLRSNKV